VGDTPDNCWIAIRRLSGPAVITAAETVAAKYNTTTQTVGTSEAVVNCTVKEFDSHSAYSAGVFTVPVAGKYKISACTTGLSAQASALGDQVTLRARKNSTTISQLGAHTAWVSSTNYNPIISGSTIINCVAGDTLDVAILRIGVVSHALTTGSTLNWVSFERIGN